MRDETIVKPVKFKKHIYNSKQKGLNRNDSALLICHSSKFLLFFCYIGNSIFYIALT